VDGASGQETLEYLERANLFIVPLDNERRWYRYHRLFKEFLSQRLEQDRAGDAGGVVDLRLRASRWHEESGLYIEAFKYATAAGDLDRAQRLVASGKMPKHSREAVITILDWLASLPSAALDERPALRVLTASMSLVAGRPKGVEEELAAAEGVLLRTGQEGENRDLHGRIATARATLAVFRYLPDEIMIQSNRALDLLAPDNLSSRMTATWTAGVAYLLRGNRALVGKNFLELESMSRKSGDVFFIQIALNGLGESQLVDNQLYDAAETYARALRSFGEHPQPNVHQTHLGLAQIHYEWNDLDTAEEEGERGLRIARLYDESVDRFILCDLFLARIKLARGLGAAAAARLDELAVAARAPNFWHRLPEIAALQVSVLLRGGDIGEAGRLAGSFELPLAQARVFLARNEPGSALALIEPFNAEMEARGWQDERLRALTLQALANHAMDRDDEACSLLSPVLKLAETGGFMRLFLDEGEPMERLVALAAAKGTMPAYAGKILAAFAAERKIRDESRVESAAPSSQGLIEPLSQREIEVLSLIGQGLSNQEIGERLFLALDTIKSHNRRIFDKLDVKRRTEAVARARELGLL
jgi:LuxR family maltose regulon positive regulatory protein